MLLILLVNNLSRSSEADLAIGVVAVAAVAGELRPAHAMTATAKSVAAARLRRMRA